MRIALVSILGLLGFAAPLGCSKCAVDCGEGYEVPENSCICRPVLDAGTGDVPADRGDASDAAGDTGSDATSLASCVPTASTCGAGSTCVDGCPASHFPDAGSVGGVCSVPGRDTCGCGAVLDTCDAPGTVCLMPACCDYPGVCVTPAERAEICSRPESIHFDCTAALLP